MNKQELILKLMEKTKQHVSHADMTRIVDGLMEEIRTAVASGDTVNLIGLGTFSAKQRAARTARNPQTGGTLQIPAKKVPAFKAGTMFKDVVNK